MSKYVPTIGIEVHLELKTNAKVFSPSRNDYNSNVNTNINSIDLGYPGVLPVVNKEVINQAIKACLGLNMKIAKKMYFDRKNYFYPDLPKGYQITQFHTPIGRDGYLEIEVCGKLKKIGVADIHIEEDTAKSVHYNGKTLLNYNRSGVPLIEIVSSADMHSKEEAIAYVTGLREIMFYLGVSDCKMEEGSMRCDVNVSVSDSAKLGVRSEIKNINSISNIGDAIDYEVKRQIKLLENHEVLEEDTRKFDEVTKTTIFMRKKDSNTDYRYFPEPDIPYLYLQDEDILNIKNNLEMLPNTRRSLYLDKGISMINVQKLISSKELSDFLNLFLDEDIDFVIASNILVGDIASYLNRNRISIFDTNLDKEKFCKIVKALEKKEISSKIFKDLLDDIMTTHRSVDDLLSSNKQLDSYEEITSVVNTVIDKYPESVRDYKNGKTNSFKFLMGMVMKESKGKVNPSVASSILQNILDNK